MLFAQKRFFVLLILLFFPFYFLRLRSVPIYQIPENVEVKLHGRISRQPYLKGSQQIIYLGPVLIRTGRFPEFFYHQKIEIVGKFQKRVINRFQTQYRAFFPAIRALSEGRELGGKFDLRVFLFEIRGYFERVVEGLLPEPQSSLLLGILFGAKRQMPGEFWQSLQKTGTLHIVVASGQNVAMVARFLIAMFVLAVSRPKALAAALAGVALYVLMVGAEAPVVRAGIMASIAFTAQFLGREQEGTLALLAAAGLMLLAWPLMFFDIGFQLSFAATAGLIWIYPVLTSFWKDGPWSRTVLVKVFGEALATTVAAQIAVMPIILINFGQISFFSPLINGAILWVVPPVMALGAVMTALGLIIRPMAQVLSWFVWLLLTYFVKIVEISGKLPWASLAVGQLSAWWAAGYYLVLIWVIVKHRSVFKTRG